MFGTEYPRNRSRWRLGSNGPPIRNDLLGFEWRRLVTQKGQSRDPNMLRAQYLENGWRYRLGSNGPPIRNDPLTFGGSRV